MSEILTDVQDVEGYALDLAEHFKQVQKAVEVGDYAEAERLFSAFGEVADDVETLRRSVARIGGLMDPDSRYDTDPRV